MLHANTNLNHVLNFFDLTKKELDQQMGEDDYYNYGHCSFELTRRVGRKEFSVRTINGNEWFWTVEPIICYGSQYYTDNFVRRTRLHLRQALRVLGKTKQEVDSAITREIDREYPEWFYGVCPVSLTWVIADGVRVDLSVESLYVEGSDEEAIRYEFTLTECAEGEGPVLYRPDDDIPF